MKLTQRFKNLWKLSAEEEIGENGVPESETLTSEPKKEAIFIARVTRDPVKEIIQENNDNH